jgi:hypothetical protein
MDISIRDYDLFASMDVDKKHIQLAMLNHDRLIGKITLPYNPLNLLRYIKKQFPDEKMLFVYEAGPTGYGPPAGIIDRRIPSRHAILFLIMVRNHLAILLIVLIFCILLSCDQENSSPAIQSGIRGVAMEEQIGGRYPPPPPTFQPLPNAILTVQPSGGGQEITRTISDAEGKFAIDLPSGTYLLVPVPPLHQGYIMNAPSQTVVVHLHKIALVSVTYILPVP